MVPVIIGVVLIAVGVVLLVLRRRAEDRLLEIKSTQTSAVADLVDLHRDVSGELGAGAFSQFVEIKGVIRCDEPITAELSGEPCVYYTMNVEERYEEQYEEQDANGNTALKTRTGSNSVASNSRSVRFHVEDESGRILIDTEKAEIHPRQTMDRYEPFHGGGADLSVGAFSLSLGAPRSGRTVLGHNYSESILPLNQRVYIIGEACDPDGELVIRNPREKGKPFIVSLKSEEEIVSSKESGVTGYLWGAIAAFVIGAALVVVGLM